RDRRDSEAEGRRSFSFGRSRASANCRATGGCADGGDPMILVLGSSQDKVYPKLVRTLVASKCNHVIVDEDQASKYRLKREELDGKVTWRVFGDGCAGSRPVGSIFV